MIVAIFNVVSGRAEVCDAIDAKDRLKYPEVWAVAAPVTAEGLDHDMEKPPAPEDAEGGNEGWRKIRSKKDLSAWAKTELALDIDQDLTLPEMREVVETAIAANAEPAAR